jgi:glutamate 5-kinase
MKMAVEKQNGRSKGGMSSKLKAAKMITESGGNVIIANGDRPDTLKNIFAAKETGTLFLTQEGYIPARKRWFGFAGKSEGQIVLDDGAADAVRNKGKSLLPIGVIDADGVFQKGGIVSLVNQYGGEIARGLSNYSNKEVLLIKGKKTSELKSILGQQVYTEVIHRNNLQITD